MFVKEPFQVTLALVVLHHALVLHVAGHRGGGVFDVESGSASSIRYLTPRKRSAGGQGAALEIVRAAAGTSAQYKRIADRVRAAGLVEGAGAIVADSFIMGHRQGALNQIVGAVAGGVGTKGKIVACRIAGAYRIGPAVLGEHAGATATDKFRLA